MAHPHRRTADDKKIQKHQRRHQWERWEHNPYGVPNLYILECGSDGDCQFHCIARALKTVWNAGSSSSALCPAVLRQLAAQQALKMSADQFAAMMTAYRTEGRSFCGGWDPRTVRTAEQYARAILKPVSSGDPYDFQGDEWTLQLLALALRVNIEVWCYDRQYTFEFSAPGHQQLIALMYRDRPGMKHYKLLGLMRADAEPGSSSRTVDTVFAARDDSQKPVGV